MGFKLVRVDATEPYKVTLSLGSHFIGRGKLLNCDDNRVSRNHAELIVTCDSILLKSLHKNPCFLKKKSTTDIIVFSQPDSQVLSNGDQFGLIPDTFWYEVIYCPNDSPTEPQTNLNEKEYTVKGSENGETQLDNVKEEERQNESESLLDANVNTSVQAQEDEASSSIEPAAEQSTDDDVDTTTEEPIQSVNPPESINQPVVTTNSSESAPQPASSSDEPIPRPVTPTKRVHSDENSPCDVKRVKTEPTDSPSKDDKPKMAHTAGGTSDSTVKTEPSSPQDSKPGPSNNQLGSSSDAPAAPASPNKPPNQPLRERCMYGAGCYRRNPQHKVQFSHPGDSDWGAGERGHCPWGAGCRRRDPRHWSTHAHPAGAAPPAPPAPARRPGIQMVRRLGNIFYIQAHAVHFHDDRFEVEDSDGDSVDYDYEF